MSEKLEELVKSLKNVGITFKIDDSNKTPGFKFAEAEVKGYPIRIELGKRDLENDNVTLVRRDTLEKIVVNFADVTNKILELLDLIQKNMFDKAKERRDSMIYEANTYEKLKEIATTKPGFIKINWCGDMACEDKIKEDTTLKSRCLIENEEITGPCVVCGKKATTRLYIGKQY